jgi:4-aminobutyrate aminotransferase-like enzyme
VRDWLERHGEKMAFVMDMDPNTDPLTVFDLSIGSPLVGGDEQANAEPEMTPRLFAQMKTAGAKIGIGRYDEARMIYTSPLFSEGSSPTAEQRTVHIGMDLFAVAGTPVYAPLSGTVHAFARNDAPLDYGPLIILKHRTDAGDIFFTLYGHLSVDSIKGLQAGRSIARGEQIATLGSAGVNGGWTPHLHFQIITDLLDLDCDFPGVVRSSQRKVWTDFSPDPNLILRIPAHCFPQPDPGKAQTLASRKKRIGRNLSIGYRDPVKVLRGWKQYLYDETGRRYLDAYNNVPHVGHCHPHVVEAAQKQMTVLNTNTRYLHDFINRYARRLCATLPDPLSVCFFVNSASEGNELALRLARSYTRQRNMIVLEASYHGHTTSLIDISPYKHDGPGGNGAPDWVHTAPIPDVYRGLYKVDEPEVGLKYARYVRELIEKLSKKGAGLAGFIAESCPSVAGQIFFPEGYLSEVYGHVQAAGGLCIADEVQTGYGRIGTHFYAFEAQEAVPDIVVLGKPIGNGHPISAVITTAEIADAFDNGMEFFSTFGGNTVSCAVGLAVLEVLQKENLQDNALRVGRRLLEGLDRFKDRYPIVGDVRGCGLFLGVELVRDRKTLAPAAEEASFVVNRMREHGILLGIDGPYHNVIKIRPPMPFSASDADLLVAAMDRILEEDFSG